MVLAIIACTLLSFTPVMRSDNIKIPRLTVPHVDGSSWPPVPSDGRGDQSWFLGPFGGGIKTWQIGVAVVPAMMLLVLFFFDHNVRSPMRSIEERCPGPPLTPLPLVPTGFEHPRSGQ